MDLFTSRLTAQLPQYVSWRPDPGAFYIDALALHWKSLMGYAFPHLILIPVVLNKVIQDNADLILVAPIWQEQPWWPILLSLLVSSPVFCHTVHTSSGIPQIQAGYIQYSLAVIRPCVESPAVLSNRRLSWTGYQTAPFSNSVFHLKGLPASMAPLESLAC